MGFVASDDARRFFLRPKVLSFSHAYLSASPLAVLAQPILDRLSDLLRESCSLAILDGDEIVYLARSTSSRIMSATLNVGRRLPAYCTSIGRVLLAHLAETELDTYLSNAKLQAFTERTITSKDRLRQTLKTVRNAGYAIADQQMEPRICTMAVPVQDSSAAVVAGINVILQGGSISPREMVPRFLRPLQDAAQDLGAALMS